MAQQKLDNRPGQVYDPQPDDSKTHPESLEKRNSPADEAAFDQIAADNRDIGSEERNASTDDGQDSGASDDENEKINPQSSDKIGSGYKEEMSGTASGSGGGFTKKKKGFLGAISLVIATVLIGGFISLPSFMLNQIREVMTGKIGDLQTRQSLRYRRSKLAKISDIFSKDGRLGGGVITEMEARGYKFRYSPTDRNTVIGLTLPNGQLSLRGEAIGVHISDYMEVKHPLRLSRWKTKRMNALYNRFGISRVSVVAAAAGDLDSADNTLRRNLAKTIDGDDVSVQTRITDLPEDATDEQKAAANEAGDIADNKGLFDDLNVVKETGVTIDEANPEAALLSREAPTSINANYHEAVEQIAKTGSVAGKSLDTVKSLGATDLADKVCIVKGRLRAAVTAARAKRAVELMRYAAAFMGAADATRNGTANSGLVSALLKQATAVDRNGNSIGASPGFAYALKNKFSKGRNDSTRSGIAVDGKLSGVIGSIQDTTDEIPATSKAQCNVWQNPLVQIGGAVVEVVAAFFSGGSTAAIGGAAKVGVITATKGAIKTAISRTVVRSLLKSFAFQAAIELSFEGIMTMTQVYAEKTLTYNFSGQEQGGELGDILTAGAGTLNKQRSLQAGMVPATSEQYASVHDEYMQTLAQERSEQSVFARYFNPKNVDSLASSVILSSPMTVEQTGKVVAVGISGIFSAPKSIVSTISGAFIPQSFAQSSDEIPFDNYVTEGPNSGVNLATDHAGNLLPIMRTDVEAIDPEENIDVLTDQELIDSSLEPIGDFKKHVETCVEAVDVISVIEATDNSGLNPTNDCLAKLPLTVRFKAHLAYIDMLDSVEAEFLPQTLSEGSGVTETGTTTPGGGVAPVGLIKGTPIVGGNTSDTPCPVSPTVSDLGIENEAYISGQRYTIRLCAVHGVRINSTYAKQYDDLFTAMLSAGYTIKGTYAFRDMASQIAGYAGGRGSGTFARPGYSGHQFGAAADISCQGGGQSYVAGTGRYRDKFLAGVSQYPCLEWVFKNSASYGLLLQCVGEGSNGGEIRGTAGGCEWWHISPTGG